MNDVAQLAEDVVQKARHAGLNLPSSILFGDGAIQHAGRLANRLAVPSLAFLVLGSGRTANTAALQGRVTQVVEEAGGQVVGSFRVDREPDVQLVDSAAAECRRSRVTLVIGCGGGSVLDSAKAVAGMAVNPGSVLDYLEGVGRHSLEHPPLPVLAIPATAGTGSEVTRNAVISVPDLAVKRSLRHVELMPRAAIVDPELTWTTSPSVTAAGGMDALTQLLEACISRKRRPETTALALAVLPLVRDNLRTCYSYPEDRVPRQAMSLVAMVSGICLANAGLGLVHGIASGLGAMKKLPHGLICAILLPHVLRFNRATAHDQLREALAAFLATPSIQTDIPVAIKAVEELKRDLNLPEDLRFLRLTDAEIRAVAERSMGSSMSGNPVAMTQAMVEQFLKSVC